MNRPMRKLIAFSAAAAMLANVPLMGASAKYVAEQVTNKEFDTLVQFPDRNVYIENGTAAEFAADQQLVVVGTDGMTKLISLTEGISGGISYASTTMGIYDFIMPTAAEYGFDFIDPSYRFSLSTGTMIIDVADKQVLVDAEGKEIASYHAIKSINSTFYEVITSEGGVGVIDKSGNVIISPSTDIFCVYLTADGIHFFVDGNGKDYFTDIMGKTVSSVYNELTFFSYDNYYGSMLKGDVPAADVTDYKLTTSFFNLKKDEKNAVVGGSKFEVITNYFDYIGFDGYDFAFVGENKLLDENGNEIPNKYSYTYFDENGKVVREYSDSASDTYGNLYQEEYLLFHTGNDEEGSPVFQRFDYLCRKASTRYQDYDQVLDLDMNILLEGDKIKYNTHGVTVEKDGKFILYNAKLEKIGEYDEVKTEFANPLTLAKKGDKCVAYNTYYEIISDSLPLSTQYIYENNIKHWTDDYSYTYELKGYYIKTEDSVLVYDTEFNLKNTKTVSEGQRYVVSGNNDVLVYDSAYEAKDVGDNYYLTKNGEDKAMIVDSSGKTIAEVPNGLKMVRTANCLYGLKDGVLTFYDTNGKLIRKFNTEKKFETVTGSDYVIINGKDDAGKKASYIYDLANDTIKYSQVGKYDKVEPIGFDYIRTTVYPEGYTTPSPSEYRYDDSDLWTNDSGFLTGMEKMDGTEVIAPTSGITLGTSQYCFGGYSRPDYRDFAIDTIYNDSKTGSWYDSDPFYTPSEEGSGVDCYIVVNGVYIPKKDFAADYAKKNGFTIAVTTQYGCYVVLKDGKWALADSEGKLLCDAKYNRICEFADGLAWAEQWEEMTLVAQSNYDVYDRSTGRYLKEGEEYTTTVRKIGIITKDGTEIVSPYYDLRGDSNHYNVERFGNTYFTYKTVDTESGRYDFGIYKGTEYFNEFTAKYGYDTAAQYGDLWLVSKGGLKGIVTADNEVVLPVEFAEILYVPASEKITLNSQKDEVKAALTDQHYSSPISDLDDGSKLVNVKTKDGKIKAYQIRDVEETTTSTAATTTSATTTTTTSATTTSVPTTTTLATTTTSVPTTTTTSATTTSSAADTTTTTASTMSTTASSAPATTTTTTSATATASTTSSVATTASATALNSSATSAASTTESVSNSTASATETGTSSTTFASSTATESSTASSTSTSQTTVASTTSESGTTTTETTPIHPADADLGDVNADGKVDAKDASMVLMAYARMSTGAEDGLTEKQRKAANVNGDDKVDAKDASSILAYYALVSTASGDIPSMKEFMTPKQT